MIIEAGVKVISETGATPYSFTVNGTLRVLGTETDSVSFTSIPGIKGTWKGITVNKNAVFEYADIRYAVDGIRVKTTEFKISNSTLSYNQNSGIYFDGGERGASGTVQFSDFNHNKTGIVCYAYCSSSGGGASPEILNNSISYNDGDGIYISASGRVPSSGSASRTSTASPVIDGNTISKNGGNAISCFANDDEAQSVQGITMRRIGFTNPKVTNNVIYDNSFAIKSVNYGTRSNADIKVTNNVVFNSGIIHSQNAEIDFVNSVIGEEAPIIKTENYGFVTFNYCCVKGQGGTNIENAPLFVDPLQGDFHLMSNSPCIDAGSNDFVDFDTDFDGKVRIWDGNGDSKYIVDMGAFEYGTPCFKNTETVNICEGETYMGWDTPGEYMSEYTAVNGCDSVMFTNLIVNPIPEKPALTQNADTLICDSSGKYAWYLNDSILAGANKQKYVVQKSGNYKVTVENDNGCTSEFSETINVIKTSVTVSEFFRDLKIYPNPTSGIVYIEGRSISTPTEIVVVDYSGKQVLNLINNSNRAEFNISEFASGIYHITIVQNNQKAVFKIIKK